MRKFRLLFVFLVLFLFSGCAIKNFPSPGELFGRSPAERDVERFYGGNEGVYFEIAEPIYEYYSSVPFSVRVDLENRGEVDVSSGEVCIFGLDEDMFEGFDGCVCEDFDLGSLFETGVVPNSGFVNFGPYDFKEKANVDSQTVSASVAYPYRSYGVVKACVREKLIGEGCEYRGKDLLEETSGGPVKIVSVKEKILPAGEGFDLLFDIEIKNKGRGFFVEEVGGCEFKEVDNFEINLVGSIEGSYGCDDVVFDKKEDEYIAKCFIKGVKPGDYKDDVIVELNYIYKEIKSNIFEIA